MSDTILLSDTAMASNSSNVRVNTVFHRRDSDVPLLGAEEDDSAADKTSTSTSSSLLDDVTGPATSTMADANEQKLDLCVQQGVVLIEDGVHYRSIHHKMDNFSIKLYRWYHSAPVKWSIYATIFVLLFLAFLETPSSLTWSSDPWKQQERFQFPGGLIEGIEFMCLLMLLASTIIQSYLAADMHKRREFPRNHPWLTVGFVVVFLSITDLLISVSLGNDVYRWRLRRLLRPFFLAGCSTMLKKTLKCIKNTLPEIASVMTLLLLHVYFFMMLGMLIFPQGGHRANVTHSELNSSEWKTYFSSIDKAFTSLLVLLTTANNPDVMMPSYSQNRFYAVYFIVFSLIGTFLIFNLLTAVVYNQFRGYFQNSMQASHFRRCVAFMAAFNVLSEQEENEAPNTSSMKTVKMEKLKKVLRHVSMRPEQRTAVHHNIINLGGGVDRATKVEFQQIFNNIDSSSASEMLQPVPQDLSHHSCRKKVQIMVLHPAFNIVSNLMVLVNAILVTVEIAIHYEQAFKQVFSRLNIMNYVFAGYYTLEQSLKITALGKSYFLALSTVYDGMITLALLVIEVVQVVKYGGSPGLQALETAGPSGISLWDCARIINILVILRLLRIIPNFQPMAVVTTTLLDIMHNLASFAGILAIIYYFFAIIGMLLFEGATNPPLHNATAGEIAKLVTYKCGTYEELQYWANNFDDFASSLVVLWDIMVVNNWGVFLEVYTRKVGPWSQLYFIAWWVISVVISVNLFIALILDHFIAKWDRAHETRNPARLARRGTVQSLFRGNMHEPSPMEINEEISKHPFLRWDVGNT